ncbi:hypothetical protein RW25_15740 [Bacillus sp. L_1B0_8]|uniref:hypothetical protein n=1 Tax=unclassified Bacillus (in: firmicutes) TaxID=185979 RepID=UPI0005B6AB72|nr:MULTISPECIES: hypothetical protein [unclassified Bacillus (in: firmicutes)]KIQ87401.1 hypothetical protein RW25_15740 [Bacillus sp. L_1B0_8]KIQ89372.1 hypothetical protein RT27_07255 [Bacillus sp. L_1B0_5]
MKIFNKIFKPTSKPKFPIEDTRKLSDGEIKFLIGKFESMEDGLKWMLKENIRIFRINNEILEFHKLLTSKFTDKLLNKSDFSKIELEILNAMFKEQEEFTPVYEFELMHGIEGKEKRDEIEDDLKQRGFKYIENVGFIRILNP